MERLKRKKAEEHAKLEVEIRWLLVYLLLCCTYLEQEES